MVLTHHPNFQLLLMSFGHLQIRFWLIKPERFTLSGKKDRLLPNICQCTAQPLSTKIIYPQYINSAEVEEPSSKSTLERGGRSFFYLSISASPKKEAFNGITKNNKQMLSNHSNSRSFIIYLIITYHIKFKYSELHGTIKRKIQKTGLLFPLAVFFSLTKDFYFKVLEFYF